VQMKGRRGEERSGEIPLSWFGTTLWKHAHLYVELVFLAACLRLAGLVEPFIFQVVIDRILPFQREASLIAVVAIFIAVSLFQPGMPRQGRGRHGECFRPDVRTGDADRARALSRRGPLRARGQREAAFALINDENGPGAPVLRRPGRGSLRFSSPGGFRPRRRGAFPPRRWGS